MVRAPKLDHRNELEVATLRDIVQTVGRCGQSWIINMKLAKLHTKHLEDKKLANMVPPRELV